MLDLVVWAKRKPVSVREISDRQSIPAPYFARAKWVQLKDLSAVSDAEVKAMIKRAYQLVAAKLTKKQQREFGLID